MVTYQSEAIYQVLPDILPLLDMNHAEAQKESYGTELDPDWEQYRQMETLGLLKIFTARDDEKIVGYDIFIVGPHRHAVGSRIAINDMTYVLPEYRGFTAIMLIKKSDKALSEMGCSGIVRHSQCNTQVHELLWKIGYTPGEIMMYRKV